ncbi:hypothetical protein DE146DRAFT_5192 [Phaeosphaeria sp. MPI-PUGE-AT-0046c]|nr:hypothetical protein DE146DRAFT_5192 [Phaeosphaeria sp. MPI-PUGE-AT-0046c]
MSVMCDKSIKTLTTKFMTSTARKTTITKVAKTPTSWSTMTSTYTSTTTEYPIHDTTTKTLSTTTTTVLSLVVFEESTTTYTATSTSTLDLIATAYPGCSLDNFRSKRAGNTIYNGSPYPGADFNSYNFTSSSTQEECCQRYVNEYSLSISVPHTDKRQMPAYPKLWWVLSRVWIPKSRMRVGHAEFLYDHQLRFVLLYHESINWIRIYNRQRELWKIYSGLIYVTGPLGDITLGTLLMPRSWRVYATLYGR